MLWTQWLRQHAGHRPSRNNLRVRKLIGSARTSAHFYRIRPGRRSGPVPELSSSAFRIFFTVRVLKRQKPGICSTEGSCKGECSFNSPSGTNRFRSKHCCELGGLLAGGFGPVVLRRTQRWDVFPPICFRQKCPAELPPAARRRR